MVVGDAGVDDRDADALARDAVLTARERRADRLPRALHRGERGPIDHDALDARIGRDRGQREVVDLADLRARDRAFVPATPRPKTRTSASPLNCTMTRERPVSLTRAMSQNRIQLVAAIGWTAPRQTTPSARPVQLRDRLRTRSEERQWDA